MLTPEWRKSTYSSSNANCVEVRASAAGVAVRDTKDREGPSLGFTPEKWQAFVQGVKHGELDLA